MCIPPLILLNFFSLRIIPYEDLFSTMRMLTSLKKAMKEFIQKYKALVLVVFLGAFISSIDRFVLNGGFKGIEEQKHFIYIGVLVAGVAVVLTLLLRDDESENNADQK